MNSLNSRMLRETIKESGITITAIARKVDISRESLYNKIDKKSEFTASEICKLSEILSLDSKQRDCIFFDHKSE